MLQALEDLDLLLDGLDGVTVSGEELFPKQFERDLLLGVGNRSCQVNLGGVALSKGTQNLVLIIEDWVFLSLHIVVYLFAKNYFLIYLYITQNAV